MLDGMTRQRQSELAPPAAQAFVLADLLSIFASFYLSYRLLPYYRPYLRPGEFSEGPLSVNAWMLLLIVPLWLVLLRRAGLHAETRRAWRFVLVRTAEVQLVGLALLSVAFFALKLQDVSRLLVFGYCALYVPVSLGLRWLASVMLAAHRGHIYSIPHILVVGTRKRAAEFIRRVRHAEEMDCAVLGCVDPEPEHAPATVEGALLLGSTSLLREYIFSQPVDIVVFAMPLEKIPGAHEMIEASVELGLRVLVVPDVYLPRMGYELDAPEVALETFAKLPVAAISTVRQSWVYLATKRAADVAVSATLLALLAPVLAVIAALIKLTSSGGPVFFHWHVVGKNKKPFVGYKFRTMAPDAEQRKAELLEQNEMQGPVFKMKRDPRVTPLGRWLRRWSLDELPQLWSVLKGDMSLVGPRPTFKEEADRFEFWQRRKLCVKPGITCLWQVNGRNHISSFEEWARMDLEYIKRASLWMDCKILLQTIPAVLRGRGAY
jgi:exopolysaccharide biosynthesis polyprenyl glycosylphosphotransferase